MKRSIVGFAAGFAAVLVACGSNGGLDRDAGGGADGGGMPSGDGAGEGATGFTEAGAIGIPTDASATVPDATSDGGFVDGAACPTSCTTDTDCDPCPQKSFGGYVCMAGVCRFLG
jgi:hypothetical protein